MKRPEMRIIAGNYMRGKKRDPEVVKIVSDKIRGRKHTEETKKKISDKAKGRVIPEHQRQMMIYNNPMKNPDISASESAAKSLMTSSRTADNRFPYTSPV